ncbi:MAG: hypothetical protein C4532_06555 [Candidatus Abyssobacteria bacterium SURF_17]|uniref:Uncharacterized protein n=1 Tax=Candidatus Abyssobacteria bacterium SURF_17 TaxID=2093361 RepID=A0A419F1L2_9BACT|nr:MAG: hypothetical protein C4532_06555 [Candidatus Abyssubacteria bacterium SURF_17]
MCTTRHGCNQKPKETLGTRITNERAFFVIPAQAGIKNNELYRDAFEQRKKFKSSRVSSTECAEFQWVFSVVSVTRSGQRTRDERNVKDVFVQDVYEHGTNEAFFC